MSDISTAEYLEIHTGDAGDGLTMPITAKAIGGGRGSLFGGVGLAAGVIALEMATGKPAVWATGQYVSTLFPPATLQLDVELPAVGRTVTQGRVTGTVAGSDAEIVSVLGAVGERVEHRRGSWYTMPDAPPPEACSDVGRAIDGESIHSHIDVRIARGMFGFTGAGTPTGDNTSLLWVHLSGVRLDAGALSILGDYSPSVLGSALGEVTQLTSLDNTIRLTGPEQRPSGWVLLENRADHVSHGFAQSSCRMWSQDGVLLATASQSMTVVVPRT